MRSLLFLFSFLMTCQFASAQLTTWTWDTYKMKFKAPSNFVIKQNDAKAFSAGNGHEHLTIYPHKGEVSYDNMLNSLNSWADAQNLSYDTSADYLELEGGYWGCYIDAVASNGNPTSILMLIDPDYPEIYMYVWLQYQADYFDTAVEMLKSFRPN